MKVVILAGGLGTRLSEETETKPKPMVLIDDKPILWHIMKIYALQGFDDFIIAAGYKGEMIEKYISNLKENWSVSIAHTGAETQTAGRISQVLPKLDSDRFMVTYGDGVGSVNIKKLLNFHEHHGDAATVTAVRPPARFGVLEALNGVVTNFGEKRQSDAGWINGGFFVFEKEAFERPIGPLDPLETTILPDLVKSQKLHAYFHEGFWQPMDTLRERNDLASLAANGNPPWFVLS